MCKYSTLKEIRNSGTQSAGVKVERVRGAAEVHQNLHRSASHQVQGEGEEVVEVLRLLV